MSNDYYNTSGWPITLSFGASVSGRSEMASIAAGFDKMAALTGNGSKFIRVNAGETAQEAVSASGTGNVVLTSGATLTGATISGSGAFTTLSASSTVSGAGFSAYLASPPAIGGTVPAAGAFTTLAASGALTPAGLVDISGASAGQVKFPATQNASADPNTLDDYEEGSWSPTVTATTPGTMSATYGGLNSARYTKVGRMVTVTIFLNFNLTKGTASGYFIIPLPSAIQSGSAAFGCIAGHDLNLASIGGGATTGFTQLGVGGTGELNLYASGVGKTSEVLLITDLNNGGQQVLLSATYSIT